MLYYWKLDSICTDGSALKFPAHSFKIYRPHGPYKHISHIHDRYVLGTQVRFCVAYNHSRETSLFEIVSTWWENNGKGDFTCKNKPIPFDVFARLFRSEDGKTWDFHDGELNRWMKYTSFENIDNRLIFKADTRQLRDRLGGLSKDVIYVYLPFQLAGRWGDEIGTAARFPSLDSWQKACSAHATLEQTEGTWYEIESNRHENVISRIKTNLASVQKDLLETEDKMETMCNAAADAMNILEEKYGIKIEEG